MKDKWRPWFNNPKGKQPTGIKPGPEHCLLKITQPHLYFSPIMPHLLQEWGLTPGLCFCPWLQMAAHHLSHSHGFFSWSQVPDTMTSWLGISLIMENCWNSYTFSYSSSCFSILPVPVILAPCTVTRTLWLFLINEVTGLIPLYIHWVAKPRFIS